MNFEHISQIKATCEKCGTTIVVEKSNFRTLCQRILKCPTCNEDINGINRIASKVFEANAILDELIEEIEPYNNITIY